MTLSPTDLHARIEAFFQRYQRFFLQGLNDQADLDELHSLYAPAFIAAGPGGVNAGHNDAELQHFMQQGFAHYRALGTRDLQLRQLRITPIDTQHSIAHVRWYARCIRNDDLPIPIEFELHYLLQHLAPAHEPRVFGWIGGDEHSQLEQHGLL